MQTITFLLQDIEIMLSALLVKYKRVSLGSSYPEVFDIFELGVIISGIEAKDYSTVLNKLATKYKGYRYIFITTDDNMFFKKDEVIWDLMRSGYIKYVRGKYQRQFNNLVQQGFGRKIIAERLKIWQDNPKYKFLIDENKQCLEMPTAYILSQDPSFFDYMPEKPTGEEYVE